MSRATRAKSLKEEGILPETYPESSQRNPALGKHRFSSPARQAGAGHGYANRLWSLTYDGVAVDLADVQILLNLLDMFRFDPVGDAPDLLRGRVWVRQCFPKRPLDEGHDAAWCFRSAAVVLAVYCISWCCRIAVGIRILSPLFPSFGACVGAFHISLEKLEGELPSRSCDQKMHQEY